MNIAEILFVVAGLLFGFAFHGGAFLFLIPFAIISFVLACLNRPRSTKQSTATIPIVTANHTTSIAPTVSASLQTEFKNISNNPEAALTINKVWERANADIDRTMKDTLQAIKGFIPYVNTALVFTQTQNPNEWCVRNYVNKDNLSVNSRTRITENSGFISQLFKPNVNRLLEGDLPSSKSLMYYVDNTPVKSIVAVPLIGRTNSTRIGAIVLDSLKPNAFDSSCASALTFIANSIVMLDYKGFLSAQKHIALMQYVNLYDYLRKFFQTMSVKDIFKQITNFVKGNISYDRFTLLAVDRNDNSFGSVIYCDGIGADQFKDMQFSFSDKGLFVASLMRNRPTMRDFQPGAYVPRINDNERKNLNLQPIFVMPIATEQNSPSAQIAICLEGCRSLLNDDHEKELLKAFASVAGFAYDKATKFEQGQEQAMRDGHTGLINKKTLFKKLRAEKSRADRNNYDIGILMMDIDHFKHVNDTYGHPIGDVVIKGIADTVSGEIRKDIDIVARFGGEEFVVGLIETNANGMVETAERIRKAVQKLSFDVHLAEPLKVTVSIGAFLLEPGFNGDLKKAVNNADQALYRAKESGRNRVMQYELENAQQQKVNSTTSA